jgi:hypothetical protein
MFAFFDKKRFKPTQQKPVGSAAPQRPKLPLSARLWAFFRPGVPYTFTDLPELQATVGNQAVNELVSTSSAQPGRGSTLTPVTVGTPAEPSSALPLSQSQVPVANTAGSTAPTPKSLKYKSLKYKLLDQTSGEDEGETPYSNETSYSNEASDRNEGATQEEAPQLVDIDPLREAFDRRELAKKLAKKGDARPAGKIGEELKDLQSLSKQRWGLENELRQRHGLPILEASPLATKEGTKEMDFDFEEFATTHYMSPIQAARYKLEVKGGRLFRRLPAFGMSRRVPASVPGESETVSGRQVGTETARRPMAKRWQLQPYDTSKLSGGLHADKDEAGSALYVLSPQGDIYSGDGEVFWAHHSSFLAGGNVAAAGMMKVVDGEIIWLSNSSGHYRPGAKFLHNILGVLEGNGVNLSSVTVKEESDSCTSKQRNHGDLKAPKWRELHK